MDPGPIAAQHQPELPAIPRATALAWRLAPLADQRRVNALLRVFGARSLPLGVNSGRLNALGLPSEVSKAALQRVRAVQDWDLAWTWAAQRFLGESRVYRRGGHHDAAAHFQRHAALSFHLAGLLVFDDPRKIRTLRASASSLFARALAELRPTVRRVEIPWRTARLPAYLALPESATPSPLVVILNGSSTSKEETLLWSDAFLDHNMAVLALDWPGSGESALEVIPTPDCDDFADGVFALARDERALDPRRIALLGFSLGGALAGLSAANDRRVSAIVAVTPPYDSRPWLAGAQPLLKRHLVTVAGGEESAARLARAFAMPGVLERTRCPVLVIGAGRDLIVPPEEALRYCAAAGSRGTLLWYPDAMHGLYDELTDWTAEAAAWLAAHFASITSSTQVDGSHTAAPSQLAPRKAAAGGA